MVPAVVDTTEARLLLIGAVATPPINLLIVQNLTKTPMVAITNDQITVQVIDRVMVWMKG